MNDKCAAGTGRFLEVIAEGLGIKLEEMGELSLTFKNEVSISSTCTVFAEQEVVSKLADGVPVADLVAGVHRGIASRVFSMVSRLKIEPDVAVTGGGAKKALPLLGRGPFFIHNADSVWTEGAAPALTRMLRKWNPAAMDCLLLLAPTATSVGYAAKGDFAMDAEGRLARRGANEVVPFAFAGVSLCDERLFKDAPEGRFSLNLLWDRALAKGKLYGVRLDGRWMHVGTPDALAEAETLFEREGA
jgi:NDP-sugar pyrophosphorylase family protein